MTALGHAHRLAIYLAGLVVLLPIIPSSGQTFQAEAGTGAHVRVGGDITIAGGETSDFVLVVQGNAHIFGTAETVVVVNGEARLTGGQVGRLVVVNGRADLTEGAEVTGDITLIDAVISHEEGTRIGGEIARDLEYWFGFGAAVLGIAFTIGFAIVLLLSGLLVAALIPGSIRAAGAALTERIGPVILAVLVVWIGFPVLGIASMITLIGIPVGLTLFLLILPVLGFLGFVVTAIRVGDEILAAARGQVESEHPYLATIVGVLVLFLITGIPVLGEIVAPVASLAGSGALALIIWDRFRGSRSAPERSTGEADGQ